jgi:aminoglycoside phosphotransferase (APT) family kinase protein
MAQTRTISLPTDLIHSLNEKPILQLEDGRSHRVKLSTEHSNLMAEVHLAPEQILIVKEPKHYPESAAARFRTCRFASPLLEKAGVVAPRYISIPGMPSDRPMLAYWRIPLRTLREIWPDLSDRRKISVLRSYGALIGRLHSVRMKGWGPILPDDASPTLSAFLHGDLVERLRPALSVEWPSALAALDELIAAIQSIAEGTDSVGGVLNHNDLHMSNVLCEEPAGDGALCVGLLDLEAAVSMPPELDFARMLVYHGPLFGQPLHGCWFHRIWEGYGRPLDPRRLAFFKAYHLLNIGFHMSMNGNGAHATQTLAAAKEELGTFA